MVDKCAVCNKNINTHKDKYFKLSGGREGLACSLKCYNQYLQNKKRNAPSGSASSDSAPSK